jgi:glutaredoxin
MKKILFLFIFSFSFLFSENLNLYLFTTKECPHCKKEKIFLEKIKKKYSYLNVQNIDIYSSKENQKLFEDVAIKLNIKNIKIPLTIIGDRYFIGFLSEDTTGKNIENAIKFAYENNSIDIMQSLKKKDEIDIKDGKHNVLQKIKLPFFKEINLKNLSLPVLTILIALVDGFNPCAMWALIMLLSFLIAVENRKKLFFLGFLFILTSAFVYFLFMVAWLNFLTFFSYINWIKYLIGSIAVIGGVFYLKEFFKKNISCNVTSSKFKEKTKDKITFLTNKKNLFFASIGIIILAFLLNLIELICSAGLPVVYLQILSMSNLSFISYYLYLLLYIFIFMLDDLIVFAIAVYTLSLLNISGKFSRYSHLIGGSILLILGILLIFKPEFLMF